MKIPTKGSLSSEDPNKREVAGREVALWGAMERVPMDATMQSDAISDSGPRQAASVAPREAAAAREAASRGNAAREAAAREVAAREAAAREAAAMESAAKEAATLLSFSGVG